MSAVPRPSPPPERPLRLVVGLGNPGPEYERTRHNAGFWWVEDLAHELGARFSVEKRFQAEMASARSAQGELRLLKPLTFMNLSGQAVGAVARFYGIEAAEILVAHDELDLAAGEIRLKFGGGHAGHNGLRDIDRHLGSRDYWRLRIGIGHPRGSATPQKPVADWVLERPRREEQDAIEAAIERALAARDLMLSGACQRASARLGAPPRAIPTAPSTP
jgi:PTH1 family peptidyl-tRNA hydrolase